MLTRIDGWRSVVRRGWIIAILLCLALASGSSAKADTADAETLADARCVLVAMNMVATQAPQQRTAGMMVAMYYLGRLDAHAPRADIERLIKAEVWKITQEELKSDAVRCGRALQRKGHELQEIGAALVR
jgi:hypothetical protein